MPSNAVGLQVILKRLAPAKINLGLHVLRRRPDGFHDLETVFLRLAWADEITVRPTPQIMLTCSDAALTTDESNLVMKAARLLADEMQVEAGAALHLDKHLPYGAGLGGGSSDAATTLRLLADAWHLDVPEDTLHRLALTLGSDVPFFLGPEAAYATGRGEVLTPLRDPATGEVYTLPFSLVVVVPPVHVNTAEAYRGVQPNDTNRPDLRALVTSNYLDRWQRELVNDFEASVFAAHPAIQEVKEALLNAGADYASMSGSGSAVFGVFEDDAKATAAAEAARLTGHRVWHGA
ncbi:MAG TPA: 4-(cytidine 5'-diphospho)-2-C-methyl-D-erythritol kinase [Rhodothermales bacterium]|nr:4-(cytidine 5'-diphospho)-2-C-methyl-D-erythritol kinase [Rhodothermales bacterium]